MDVAYISVLCTMVLVMFVGTHNYPVHEWLQYVYMKITVILCVPNSD